jgi:hypothetical protein
VLTQVGDPTQLWNDRQLDFGALQLAVTLDLTLGLTLGLTLLTLTSEHFSWLFTLCIRLCS